MQRLLAAYRKLDICVTEEWIRKGEDLNHPPSYRGSLIDFKDIYIPLALTQPILQAEDKTSHVLEQEIEFFKKSSEQTVVAQLNHACFDPMLKPGDWIGGIWQENFHYATPVLAILQLSTGLFDVALVSQFSSTQWQLSYLSGKPTHLEPFKPVAPVIRVWRPF
jgi:hypothetical protein